MSPDLAGSVSRADLARFVQDLRHFVLEERDAQRRQIELGWSKPLPERVADGLAIEGVSFNRLLPEGGIELICERNQSRFREGDVLCLNRSNPFFQPYLNVSLEVDDEEHLRVYPAGPETFDLNSLQQEPEGWILDQGYQDLSRFALDALAEAGDTLVGIQRILPLLLNKLRPNSHLPSYQRAMDFANSMGLNGDQSEALAQAYASDLTWLVQGPPGTGKTFVLARLAQLLAQNGERVLITAFTHRAINNALNKLAYLAPDTPVAKIGAPHRADDLVEVENFAYFNQSPMAAMSAGYVLGATPFATRTNRLSGVDFETIIFDEASQITLPLAVMGMLAGKRYIFFGDQKQLPPVLAGRDSDGALRDSIFATLADQGFDTLLTETYRLNAALAAWPSKTFYAGRLKPAPENAAARLGYLFPPTRFETILDPQHPKVFVDLQHRNATTRNRREAALVVDLLLTLLASGVPPNELGVVVPYRAQGREIRSLLKQTLLDPDLRRQVVIDTVERMQGQEREAILISLATSNPTFAAQLADFFFQPERLNVAITRPRTKLIIVGSSHVLRAEPQEPEGQAAVALFRDLIHSCFYQTVDYTA